MDDIMHMWHTRAVLTPAEAARVLRMSRSKTYAMIRSGELPAIHIGRAVRVPVRALEAWIDEQAARERRAA
jgi:excisionase family DNA binding protein